MSRQARKGLRRVGMRTWKVTGEMGTFVIERERGWHWLVYKEGAPRPAGFFMQKFTRLWEAREFAEKMARVPAPATSEEGLAPLPTGDSA